MLGSSGGNVGGEGWNGCNVGGEGSSGGSDGNVGVEGGSGGSGGNVGREGGKEQRVVGEVLVVGVVGDIKIVSDTYTSFSL